MCHIAGHTGQMIEAFISFGISRGLCFRQKRLDLACNSDCIDHRVFCSAWVDVKSGHREFRSGCIEVFEFDFSLCAAVHGIGKLCVKTWNIKKVRAFTDLLIRCKSDGNRTVRDFSGKKGFCQCHNLCHARLVVCTEHRCSIACDQRSAGQGWKMREYRNLQCSSAVSQLQILSVIIFMYDRIYRMICKIGYRIHVCDKSQFCLSFVSFCCRNFSIDIAFILYTDIRYAKRFHFFCKLVCQDSLTLGRRMGSALLIARCRHFNIIQ